MMLPLLFLVAVTSALDCGLKPAQNLTATKVTHETVELTWSTPSAEDLRHVRGYRICRTIVETYGDGFDLCLNVWNPDISGYEFTELTPCLEYNVSVSVLGERNTSSVPVFANVATAPNRYRSLDHSRKDNDTITVTWEYLFYSRYQKCATQFQLTYCVVRRSNCTTENIPIRGVKYTLDFQKERDCNAYSIELVVLDRNQQKSDDPALSYYGSPDIIGVPENLKVTNYSSNSIDVNWTIPAAQLNCYFFVNVHFDTNTEYSGISYTTSYEDDRNSHSQIQLTPCMEYVVTVDFGRLFNNSVGKSSTKAYTLPEGDKIFDTVAIQEKTPSTVTVTWTTSLKSTHCIAAYTVCWRNQSDTNGNCRNATVEDRRFQITNLDTNTTYQVSVAALLKTGLEFDKEILEAATNSGPEVVLMNYK